MTKQEWLALKKGDRVICFASFWVNKIRETATVYTRLSSDNDYIAVIFDKHEHNTFTEKNGIKTDVWGNHTVWELAP